MGMGGQNTAGMDPEMLQQQQMIKMVQKQLPDIFAPKCAR